MSNVTLVLAGILTLNQLFGQITGQDKDGKLTIFIEKQAVLSYQYETVFPRKGIDSSFQRSGFVHPIYTLDGQRLTQIQPEDHYHHYGLWNPWTHVLFEGDTLDFWNLGKKQATVRFAGFQNLKQGKDFYEFQVFHEHVVFRGKDSRVALNEIQTIKVHRATRSQYAVNLTIDYTCATSSSVKLLEYRYGGLGWRATELWDDTNSTILTSSGKVRADADGSLEQWILAQSTAGGGMLILSHPQNYNHPEPVRVWPVTEKEKSVFICLSPTKNTEWLLEPRKSYQLRYRLIVFSGSMDAAKADKEWKLFSGKE